MYQNGADAIFVLPAGANGSVSPVRMIAGALTGLQNTSTNQVQAMTVDPSGTIYVGVSNNASPVSAINIIVFDPSQSGNVAPARRITGVLKSVGQTPSNIYMNAIWGMATDASGNMYAALNTDTNPYKTSIVEFAPGANGIATPVKIIGGTATGLGLLSSLAVDSSGNVYVSCTDQTSNVQMSIRSFGASGSENLTPASVFLVQVPAQGVVSHIGQLAVR